EIFAFELHIAPAGGTAPPPDASSSAAAIHADTSAVTAPSLRGENLVDKILTCSFPVEVVTLATSSLVISAGDLIVPRSRARRSRVVFLGEAAGRARRLSF